MMHKGKGDKDSYSGKSSKGMPMKGMPMKGMPMDKGKGKKGGKK